MYREDDLVMISALQHLLFCPPQCALIHIEQQWTENRLTAEGRILHERVHTAGSESRGKIRVEFDVPIVRYTWGLSAGLILSNFICRKMESGSLSPLNINAGGPKRMILIEYSFAPRLFVLKRCLLAK